MIKYIIGGVLVVLAWALAFVFGFSVWIPTGVTAIVALTILLSLGIDRLKERRAARELERAIAAQAAKQAATVRPDLAHEVAEMQGEFQKAVAALKTSKKGGTKALYALPWYTIIGPPGSGKSTALRNSGIQFPYLSASGGGVRGLGGTRNCDWWMTSDAVILDTAGRWTSEDDDRDEWLAFLDLVKRYRPKKPLNGIIAAVSVGELGGAREDEVIALARRLRDRIDEVQGRLALSLPVYVLFTKCDLIPGFVETFGEMSKDERGQVWGFTTPLTKRIGTPGEVFAKGFDALVAALDRRTLKRMSEERKIGSRELIFAFPQQLAVLRQNLGEFVHQIFLENVFRETPRMRGVYFTSGTQEGRPIDRLISAMAGAFGQPQVQLPTPQVESKSYFLRDLFTGVVFKDALVAVRSPEELARQRRRTYLAAGLIALVALGIGGLPAIAWARNRSFLAATRSVIDDSRARFAAAPGDRPLEPEAIEPLRERVEQVEEYAGIAGPDPFMQMGMYQDEVYAPMRRMYLAVLQHRVFEPLVDADAAEMEAFGRNFEALGSAAHPEAEQMRETYQRLKLHLLLTRPQGEHEPPLDRDLRDFITIELHKRWASATATPRSDPHYEHLRWQVEYYVAAMEDDPHLFFPRSDDAVGRVRAVFNAVGGFDMAVHAIVEEVRPRGADMTAQRLLGRDITALRGRERVRFAFTRDGWERHVQRMLETDAPRFFGEYWVLGHPPPDSERQAELERQQQVEGLRSYFLEQYAAEWQRFIGGLEVAPIANDQEAFVMLTQLTSGEPMRLTQLFRAIDREVSIRSAPVAARDTSLSDMARQRALKRLGKAGSLATAAENRIRPRDGELPPNAMTPERVRERFVGFLDFSPPETATPDGQTAQTTPCAQYEEQLEFLREALRFKIDGTNVTNYAERQVQARAFAETLIRQRPLEWQPRFRTLLMPPIDGTTPPAVAPMPAAIAPR